MFSSENPYGKQPKQVHPDEELIKTFDKLRTMITHPIKGTKVREALVGLVLKHPDIGDLLASAIQSPDTMQEYMEKNPHLTGYTGRPMSERSRESGQQEMLDYINNLQEEMTAPPASPEIPEDIAHLFNQPSEPNGVDMATGSGLGSPMAAPPPPQMDPATTPYSNRPTNPNSGRIMGMGGQ